MSFTWFTKTEEQESQQFCPEKMGLGQGLTFLIPF